VGGGAGQRMTDDIDICIFLHPHPLIFGTRWTTADYKFSATFAYYCILQLYSSYSGLCAPRFSEIF
jgi:hypothetical protein